MLYVTADLHLGHKNIIEYENRPFASTDEMDKTIIGNFNNIIKPDDVIYHIGDYCIGKPDRYLEKFTGNWFFLWGNHDKAFSYIPYSISLKYAGRLIVMCHFPEFFRENPPPADLYLTAHSHSRFKSAIINNLQKPTPLINVGIDNYGYKPVDVNSLLI